MMPHGLLLLFEVGTKPPHDGVRRMGRYNLLGALAAEIGDGIGGPSKLTPPVVPREGIFLPEQNRLSPCLPAVSAAG